MTEELLILELVEELVYELEELVVDKEVEEIVAVVIDVLLVV